MRNVTKDGNKCDGVVLPWWVWLAGPVFLPDDLSSSSLSSHTDTPNDPSCDLWVWPPLSSSVVAGSDGCQGTIDRYVISEQMEETKFFLHGFFSPFFFFPGLGVLLVVMETDETPPPSPSSSPSIKASSSSSGRESVSLQLCWGLSARMGSNSMIQIFTKFVNFMKLKKLRNLVCCVSRSITSLNFKRYLLYQQRCLCYTVLVDDCRAFFTCLPFKKKTEQTSCFD